MQLINAATFFTPAKKSLGNKRCEIREDVEIPAIMEIYNSFENGKYSKVYDNKDFGYLELTVEQPKRDEDGHMVMKKGAKVADSDLRSTERVRLDVNVKEYFENEVLPHIDEESWIDFAKTRIGYEINFQQYFYEYKRLEPSETIEKSIKDRMFGTENQKGIVELINAIFAN